MTGAPPYNAQSPTQQHHFAVYNSPSKNRSYYPINEQQQQQYPQHPPQTPPAYGASVARSPGFSHASSPLPTAMPPPLNGNAQPPHPESSSQYHGLSSNSTPQFPLPRPFSSSMLPGNSTSPFAPPTPHGHPPSRPDAHSPSLEPGSPYHMRGNGAGYPSSIMREQRPASPAETV